MGRRLDRIDARFFRADSVRFEPCPSFRKGADPQLCTCGWLEHDHAATTVLATREQNVHPDPATFGIDLDAVRPLFADYTARMARWTTH